MHESAKNVGGSLYLERRISNTYGGTKIAIFTFLLLYFCESAKGLQKS